MTQPDLAAILLMVAAGAPCVYFLIAKQAGSRYPWWLRLAGGIAAGALIGNWFTNSYGEPGENRLTAMVAIGSVSLAAVSGNRGLALAVVVSVQVCLVAGLLRARVPPPNADWVTSGHVYPEQTGAWRLESASRALAGLGGTKPRQAGWLEVVMPYPMLSRYVRVFEPHLTPLWHTPLTGIYHCVIVRKGIWYPGGTPNAAAHHLELRDRPFDDP